MLKQRLSTYLLFKIANLVGFVPLAGYLYRQYFLVIYINSVFSSQLTNYYYCYYFLLLSV